MPPRADPTHTVARSSSGSARPVAYNRLVLPALATARIVEEARGLGFALCGVAPVEEFPELERLPEWLARGYAGEMRYLEDPRRESPLQVLPSARSLIVCAMNYNAAEPLSTEFAGASLAPNGFHRPSGGSDFRSHLINGSRQGTGLPRFPRPDAFGREAVPKSGHSSGALAPEVRGRDSRSIYEMGSSGKDADVVPCSTGSSADAAPVGASDQEPIRTERSPRGWISRYAWGDDYHRVLGEKLELLLAAMRCEFREPFDARVYVDTGPIVERVAAKHAGLGWLAKNTCLIHPEQGSWLFLGVILTTLELAPTLGPGEPPQPDLCGQCTLCLEACPTGALVEPYVLDARRCISYLTIEHRGSLPEDLRPAMGAHVFGCDICQDVCPWNRKAPVTSLTQFAPQAAQSPAESAGAWSLFAPDLEWLVSLSEDEYRRIFRGSTVKRAKYRGLVRNACVALGNAAAILSPAVRERVRAQLDKLAAGSDTLIAEHAAWALARIGEIH
jgi:epoxyqueuosine reductase